MSAETDDTLLVDIKPGTLEGGKKSRCIRSPVLYATSRKIQRYAIRGLVFCRPSFEIMITPPATVANITQ